MTRQEILDQQDGPRLWAVFHEAVLSCEVGGPDLMRDQCRHLLRMSRHPRVVIQVVPNKSGLCCGFGRSFSQLAFRHQSDLVYVEDVGSARYIREQAEVARYALMFDYLRASALAYIETAELIGVIGND